MNKTPTSPGPSQAPDFHAVQLINETLKLVKTCLDGEILTGSLMLKIQKGETVMHPLLNWNSRTPLPLPLITNFLNNYRRQLETEKGAELHPETITNGAAAFDPELQSLSDCCRAPMVASLKHLGNKNKGLPAAVVQCSACRSLIETLSRGRNEGEGIKKELLESIDTDIYFIDFVKRCMKIEKATLANYLQQVDPMKLKGALRYMGTYTRLELLRICYSHNLDPLKF